MLERDYALEARERRQAATATWSTIWKIFAVVLGFLTTYFTGIVGFPRELQPNTATVSDMVPILALAGLTFLYFGRPILERTMDSQSPVVARVPRARQDELVTRAIGRHGFSASFHLYVLPDAIAYALVALGSLALARDLDGLPSLVLWVVGLAHAWRAIAFGFAWVLPRRRVASTYGYLRREQQSMTRRIRTGKSDATTPTAQLPAILWNPLVRWGFVWARFWPLLAAALVAVAAAIIALRVPAAALAPEGVAAFGLVVAIVIGALAFAKGLAWSMGNAAAKLIGELGELRRANAVEAENAEELYRAIEVLRANHICISGGLDAVLALVEDKSPLPHSPFDALAEATRGDGAEPPA